MISKILIEKQKCLQTKKTNGRKEKTRNPEVQSEYECVCVCVCIKIDKTREFYVI